MAVGKRAREKALEVNGSATKRAKTQPIGFPFLSQTSTGPSAPKAVPFSSDRIHAAAYHRPALLDNPSAQEAFLAWFTAISKNRDMPWRQKWIDPAAFDSSNYNGLDLREAMKRRAYQVWVSEIMLQQTRVETVRAYYHNWHSKWPRIEDLASAEPSDVLGAWKGLGYYSRATRLHTAAKTIVADSDMDGLLPEQPAQLQAKVPGVGPYTAGAVSSIVFGHAVPIVDGNVMRVLSRQMGLHANMANKTTINLLWETAHVLVKQSTRNALARQGDDVTGDQIPRSEIPSLWNQALMELGSTVCKPVKPDCETCPIKTTCLAYSEAEQFARNSDVGKSQVLDKSDKRHVPDIEDLCTMCDPLDESIQSLVQKQNSKKAQKGQKDGLRQTTLSFGKKPPPIKESKDVRSQDQDMIAEYIQQFPMKVVKKAARQEECVVCIICRNEGDDSTYLIEQRPEKGLLAGLWQFPTLTLQTVETTESADEASAGDDEEDYVPKSSKSKRKQAKGTKASSDEPIAEQADKFALHVAQAQFPGSTISSGRELGTVVHLFSHIRLTMHVFKFELKTTKVDSSKEHAQKKYPGESPFQSRQWASEAEVNNANIGTGMVRCWNLDHRAS